MRSFSSLVLFALSALVIIGGIVPNGAVAMTLHAAPSTCNASLVPTLTWNGRCRHPNEGTTCFTPDRLPGPTDVLSVPPSTVLRMNNTIWGLRSLVVHPGGVVLLSENAEIFTSECFVVYGTLNITGGPNPPWGSSSSGPGWFFFPEDPTVPLATCADMPGGFSPRLCGPGPLFVYGSVAVEGLYSALWAHTVVMPGGRFALEYAGAFVGSISNYGEADFKTLSYMFGSATNFGTMRMGAVQFGTNYPLSIPPNLNVTNHGLLELNNFDGVSPSVNMTLTNYNVTVVNNPSPYGGYDMFLYVDPIYNHGNITFINGPSNGPFPGFHVQADIYNTGVLVSSMSAVYVYSYFSLGGKLVTKYGGTFTFGNGAGPDRHQLQPCEVEMPVPVKRTHLPPKPPILNSSTMMLPCTSNNTCTPPEQCVNGFCKPVPCSDTNPCSYSTCCQGGVCVQNQCEYGECCPGNEGCEAYHTGVYCGGYGVFQWREERECRKTLKLHPIPHGFAQKAGLLGRRVFAQRRYSFQHGSVIDGDIISTEPVELLGEVTLRGDRSNWFAMSEFELPVFTGSGTLVVLDRARLVLGLNSTLSDGGSITVGADASLLIPRQSTVLVGNHSINIDRASSVQVDGALIVTRAARIQNFCPKTVAGEGSLAYDDRFADGVLC